MKLYLASFLQPENFGPGKVISITSTSKPRNINVTELFLPLTPPADLLSQYYDLAKIDQKQAGEFFTTAYKSQCADFVQSVLDEAAKENCSPEQVLPFAEGDTLCSWERAQFTNYRKILCPYLEKLGYDISNN